MGEIGIGCRVLRKPDGSIDRVLDLNGKKSTLFRDAMALIKDEGKALSVWATAYTSDFIHKYGWNRTKKEPELDVVLDYIQRNKTGRFQMSIDSVQAFSSLMADSGMGATELKNLLRKHFVYNGNVVVSKERMIDSGIYSLDELESVDSFEMIESTIKDILNSNIDDIYYLPDSRPELAVSDTSGKVDSMGRLLHIRGDSVYNELLKALIGVNTQSGLVEAIESFKYDEVAELYKNDEGFKKELLDIVSGKKGFLVGAKRTNFDSDSFSEWKSSIKVDSVEDLSKALESVQSVLDRLYVGVSGDFYKAVREVEVRMARIGVNLLGLSDYIPFIPVGRFSDLMAYLYKSFDKYGFINDDALLLSYNEFQNIKKDDSDVVPVLIDKNVSNVFVSNNFISPREAFEKGYIRVSTSHDSHPVYMKSTILDNDSMYEMLYRNVAGYKNAISGFKYGIEIRKVFDTFSKKNAKEELTFEDFKESMDTALKMESSYDKPEGLILHSIVFLIDPSVSMNVNKSDEATLSRIYTLVNPDVLMSYSSVDVDSMSTYIKRRILLEGARRTVEYNSFWKYVSVGYDSLSISMEGLSNINSISDNDVNVLRTLAARKPNTPLSVLDALSHGNMNVSDISSTKEFKRAIYYTNPNLIQKVHTGAISDVYGSMKMATNEYSDFIRINSDVYEKVYENHDGGVYYKLDGTNPSISSINMEIEKHKNETPVRSFVRTNPINKIAKKDSKVNIRC